MYRVDKHWERFIEVSLEQFRTNDEASGCAFIDAHHYQHTDVGYNLSHKVDVEDLVPIRLSISLLVCFWFLYRWDVEVREALSPRLANCRCNRARPRPKSRSQYRLHRSLNPAATKSNILP